MLNWYQLYKISVVTYKPIHNLTYTDIGHRCNNGAAWIIVKDDLIVEKIRNSREIAPLHSEYSHSFMACGRIDHDKKWISMYIERSRLPIDYSISSWTQYAKELLKERYPDYRILDFTFGPVAV